MGQRRSRDRSPPRRPLLALSLAAALWGGAAVPAGEAPSALQFTSATLAVGERGEVRLEAVTGFSVRGFSISASCDPAVLAIIAVDQKDTMCEAIPVDYFKANVDPAAGTLVMGILVESLPPFTGRTYKRSANRKST